MANLLRIFLLLVFFAFTQSIRDHRLVKGRKLDPSPRPPSNKDDSPPFPSAKPKPPNAPKAKSPVYFAGESPIAGKGGKGGAANPVALGVEAPIPAPIFVAAPTAPVAAPVPTSSDVVVLTPTSSDFPLTPHMSTSAVDNAAACDAAARGNVFVSDQQTQIRFFYELLTYRDRDQEAVAVIVDSKIQQFLLTALMDCAFNNGGNGQLNILGVGSDAKDIVVPDGSCATYATTSAVEVCYLLQGSIVLYMSPDSEVTNSDAAAIVFALLASAINGDRRALQTGGFLDAELGILGLRFIGGQAVDKTPGPSSEVPDTTATTAAANQAVQNEDSSMSGMGVTMIVAAAFGLAIVAFFTIRRKRKNREIKTKGVKLDHEEDEDYTIYFGSTVHESGSDKGSFDIMKEQGPDGMTIGFELSPIAMPARILLDEDSTIYTGIEENASEILRQTVKVEYSASRMHELSQVPTFIPADNARLTRPSTARSYVMR